MISLIAASEMEIVQTEHARKLVVDVVYGTSWFLLNKVEVFWKAPLQKVIAL